MQKVENGPPDLKKKILDKIHFSNPFEYTLKRNVNSVSELDILTTKVQEHSTTCLIHAPPCSAWDKNCSFLSL